MKRMPRLIAACALAMFITTEPMAAPPVKAPSVAVVETGSGSLTAYGSVVLKDVVFTYGEVRHVSLTLAYYTENTIESQADLFAGPVWFESAIGREVRSKAFFETWIPPMRSEDGFDVMETRTVEFDADHWKIELISLSSPEKFVYYRYTVTYPKP